MKSNYQVIKLTNGEDIICDLKESESGYLLKVKSPLKMEIVNRVTKSGMVEGLALTRWVQPFTEQESVMINKSTVVTMVPASVGMSKYYRYVLKSIDTMKLITSEDIEPTKEELSAIENEEKLNKIEEELKSWDGDEKMSLEELIEETSEFLKRNRRTIH
tara:strand:+ start:115 stop:594 length:480 start_codon:yes stop_codon:yes gene_type:complete